MNDSRLEKTLSVFWSVWLLIISILRATEHVLKNENIYQINVWLTFVIGVIIFCTIFMPNKYRQIVHILVCIACGVMVFVDTIYDQFGVIIFIICIYLLHKYGIYKTYNKQKILITIFILTILIISLSYAYIIYEKDYTILFRHFAFWLLCIITFFICEISSKKDIERKDKKLIELEKLNAELISMEKKLCASSVELISFFNNSKYLIDSDTQLAHEIRAKIELIEVLIDERRQTK